MPKQTKLTTTGVLKEIKCHTQTGHGSSGLSLKSKHFNRAIKSIFHTFNEDKVYLMDQKQVTQIWEDQQYPIMGGKGWFK